MMTALFYSIGILAIFFEIVYFKDPAKMRRLFTIQRTELDDDERNTIGCLSVITLIYIVWSILGLFTNEWPLFAVIIILSLFPKRSVPIWVLKVDAILSIAIIIFAMLNHFHFHINFTQWILDLF